MAESPELQRQNELLEEILRQRQKEASYLLQSEDLTSKISRNYEKILDSLPNITQYHKDLSDDLSTQASEERNKLESLQKEVVVMGNITHASKILSNVFSEAGEHAQKMSEILSKTSNIALDWANRENILNKNKKEGVNELDKKYNILTARLLALKMVYTGISLALSTGIERFKELEKSASDFRRETGLLITQTEEYDGIAKQLSLDYGYLGMTLEEARKAQSALVNEFSSGFNITKGMQKNVALMQTNLGLSVEDTSKLYALFNGMEKSSGETNETLMNLAIKLALAGKIAPKKVFNDIASASSDTLNFFSGMPKKMISVAVEARKVGTTLDSLSKSARGMLNFQESITAEMELSALLGRSVNLQLSREYAWLGENLKAREAALDQLGTLDDFNRMSIFEKEAAARALQMETGEIIKQLGIREEQAAYEAQIRKDLMSGDASTVNAAKERKEELQKYLDLQKKSQDSSKKTQEQMANEYGNRIRTNNLMNEFEKLSANIRQIWNGISEPLQKVAEILLKVINPVLWGIGQIVSFNWATGLAAFVAGLGLAYVAMKKLTSLAGAGIGKILGEALKKRNALEEVAKGAMDSGKPGKPTTPAPWLPGVPQRRPAAPPSAPTPPSPSIPDPSRMERTGKTLFSFSRLAGISFVLISLGASLFIFSKALKEFDGIQHWDRTAAGLGAFGASLVAFAGIAQLPIFKVSARSLPIIAFIAGLELAIWGFGKAARSLADGIDPILQLDRAGDVIGKGLAQLALSAKSIEEMSISISIMTDRLEEFNKNKNAKNALDAFSKDPFKGLREASEKSAQISNLAESIEKLYYAIKDITNENLSKFKLNIEMMGLVIESMISKFGDLKTKITEGLMSFQQSFSDIFRDLSEKIKSELNAVFKISIEIVNLEDIKKQLEESFQQIFNNVFKFLPEKIKNELNVELSKELSATVKVVLEIENLKIIKKQIYKEFGSIFEELSKKIKLELSKELGSGTTNKTSLEITNLTQIQQLFDKIPTMYADMVTEMSKNIKQSVEGSTSKISVEINNLTQLNEAISNVTNAVTRLGELVSTSQKPAAESSTISNNTILENKLDKLINLLVEGKITATVDLDKLSAKSASPAR